MSKRRTFKNRPRTWKQHKKFRILCNMTQAQLAEAANCNDDKISQYELGKLQPDMIFVRIIADCLNVTLDILLPPIGGYSNYVNR